MRRTARACLKVVPVGALGACIGCAQVDGIRKARLRTRTETPKEATVKSMKGGCHCGQVRYEAPGPVVKCSYCDCGGCRKATGTLKAPFVTVHREGFALAQGETREFQARSGESCDAHGTWHFCPDCGTQIFWRGHQGGELDLFAGTLDDASVFQP